MRRRPVRRCCIESLRLGVFRGREIPAFAGMTWEGAGVTWLGVRMFRSWGISLGYGFSESS